jgi:uncharacterized membrane protein
MDTAHLHLIITHLPIFGSLLGTLVLLYSLWTKSDDAKIVSFGLLVISSIGAGVAYLSGEGAEEKVEGLPGVLESIIEQHEDAAKTTLILMIALGVFSLISLFFTRVKHAFARTATYLTLVLALASFAMVARTGYLGGQIRHTEIRSGGNVQNNNADQQENQGKTEEDDD